MDKHLPRASERSFVCALIAGICSIVLLSVACGGNESSTDDRTLPIPDTTGLFTGSSYSVDDNCAVRDLTSEASLCKSGDLTVEKTIIFATGLSKTNTFLLTWGLPHHPQLTIKQLRFFVGYVNIESSRKNEVIPNYLADPSTVTPIVDWKFYGANEIVVRYASLVPKENVKNLPYMFVVGVSDDKTSIFYNVIEYNVPTFRVPTKTDSSTGSTDGGSSSDPSVSVPPGSTDGGNGGQGDQPAQVKECENSDLVYHKLSQGCIEPLDPSQVNNKLLWLDASTLSLSDGASLSGWNDSSENAAHFTAGSCTNLPQFSATGLNGKPTVIFNNAILYNNSLDFTETTRKKLLVFAVYSNYDSESYYFNIWTTRQNAFSKRHLELGGETLDKAYIRRVFFNADASTEAASLNGDVLYVNSKSYSGSEGGVAIGPYLYAWENYCGSYFSSFILSELLVIDGSDLSADDEMLNRIEVYLSKKWGITLAQ